DKDSEAPLCGIVIPVGNPPGGLPELLERLAAVVREIPGWQFHLLLVDDGLQPPLPEFRLPDLPVSRRRHPHNRGKGAALRTGFDFFLRFPHTVAVITLDADLQHPPERIPAFLEAFEQGRGELILGRRRRELRCMPVHRILSNTLTSWIISLMIGRRIRDSQCGFRLYSRQVLERIPTRENRFHLESEFVIRCGWAGMAIGQVPVPTIYNGAPSAIRNLPDTWNFITLIFRLLKERMLGYV
ncbi:MAG: glycosyltransferase family 2 protein, partial [Calditrichaeota bacterium]